MGSIKKIFQSRQKLKEFVREARQLDGNLFLRWGKILAFLTGAKVVGKLDFQEHPITMRVKGVLELGRLSACRKEPETVQWIKDFVRPGDVFYDIGANVGAYSLIAWDLTGGRAKIYAFEPGTPTFAALKENIALNNASGAITPYQIACTEKTGVFTFHYRSKKPGDASHVLTKAGEPPGGGFPAVSSETVKGYALDDFVSNFGIDPPSHMKIDVDGAELAALKGAGRILADRRLKSVLIEVDEKRPEAQEVMNTLIHAGLKIHGKYMRGSGSKRVFNCVLKRETPPF